MALVASVLCYLIYYHALTLIPASRIAAFSYVQPLLATLIAIPTLGERPTTSLITGGALVIVGVIMAERL
jgi:drug/metabolite transporter (DMT)-like permease